MQLRTGLGLSRRRRASAAAAVGGLVATVIPHHTPAVHYHPHTATLTNFSAGAAAVGEPVQTCVDRQATANLIGLASGTAPLLDQDGLGRKFLNYQSCRYGAVESGLTGQSSQAMAVFMVVRVHRLNTYNLYYPRYQSDGTTANASNLGAMRLAAPTGSTVVFPATGGNATNAGVATATGDQNKMLVGSNIAVIGMVSRTTGNGGVNHYYNEAVVATAAQVTARTGMIGGVIGGTPAAASAITPMQAPGSVATTVGLDVYEAIVINGTVTDGQALDIIAAFRANWTDIATYDKQVALEGDSITDGIVVRFATDRASGVESDQRIGMVMTEPGALLVPATTKVITLAVSGALVSSLVTRRDGTISPYAMKLTGGSGNNVVIPMIGRNDYGAAITPADHFTNLKNLLHTGTSTGYLERGWDVVVPTPIAGSSSYMTDFLDDVRNRITGSGYDGIVADMTALSAGYATRVSVLRCDLIEVGGATIFQDSTDAASLTNYQQLSSNPAVTDNTHPNGATGTLALATGGDTPQHGYGAIA